MRRGVMQRDSWAGLALLLLFSFATPCAAQTGWQPSQGHTQVPIWPGVIPDARPVDGPEVAGWVEEPADRAKSTWLAANPGPTSIRSRNRR